MRYIEAGRLPLAAVVLLLGGFAALQWGILWGFLLFLIAIVLLNMRLSPN